MEGEYETMERDRDEALGLVATTQAQLAAAIAGWREVTELVAQTNGQNERLLELLKRADAQNDRLLDTNERLLEVVKERADWNVKDRAEIARLKAIIEEGER